MTIEDAIRILSPNSKSRLVRAVDGFLPTQKVLTALEIAISALRAQQTPLDRSRWEGCQECTPQSCGTCLRYDNRNTGDPCTTSCIKHSKYKPVNFCKNCGRPLTDEAWAELERRINSGTTD